MGTASLRSCALAAGLLALLVAPAPARADEAEGGRTWLGIGIEPGSRGVRLTQVYPLTPAFASGLEEGDEIVAVGRERVRQSGELQEAIRLRPAGSRVFLDVLRGERHFRVAVVLEAMPSLAERLGRILIGKRAPLVALEPVAGTRVTSFADLRGKVVVAAFVLTFEEPSRRAVEALAKLAADHGQELAVVAVSAEDPGALRAFASRSGGAVAVAHDPGGRAGRAYLAEDPWPLLVVIDARGVIRHAAAPGSVPADAPATAPILDGANQALAAVIEGAVFAAQRELRRASRAR